MQAATVHPSSTSAWSDGSRTQTITNAPEQEAGSEDVSEGSGQPPSEVGILRLRARRLSGNRVAWSDDVVDNEGAGKKKSKICCIYHRPKRYDESSSDSDSSDESDEEHDHSRHSHSHSHGEHNHGQASSSAHPQQAQGEIHTLDLPDENETNAYEKALALSKGKGKGKRHAGS